MVHKAKIVRIVGMWLALGALLAASLVYLRSSGDAENRGPVRLGNIELLATETTFDEGPTYEGENNLFRGNFVGSLFSTDQACQANREITAFLDEPGSARDVPVAFSTSDNTGSTGNFTTSEWHDPPATVDTYYLVVAPDTAKGCDGVISDPVVV